jgi:CheY-like chemotaxis protein
VDKAPPDVVISDIAMPGMDGIELCRRLHERLPKLPIILMSGQATAIEPDRIRNAGASALLAKPFTMRQVVELIGDVAGARPK